MELSYLLFKVKNTSKRLICRHKVTSVSQANYLFLENVSETFKLNNFKITIKLLLKIHNELEVPN